MFNFNLKLSTFYINILILKFNKLYIVGEGGALFIKFDKT